MAFVHKRRILIGALAAPILFLAYRYFIPDHAENSFSTQRTAGEQTQKTEQNTDQKTGQGPAELGGVSPSTMAEEQQDSLPEEPTSGSPPLDEEQVFRNKLKIESRKIGQISADPQLLERQLNNWASSLKDNELKLLQSEALSINSPADERFFAVDLLARNPSQTSDELLEQIVIMPLPTQFGSDPNSARSFEFELILRQRALDGVAEGDRKLAQEALKRVLQKTENPSIADRAHRHQAHLEGKAPTVVEQEQQALQQLLKSQAKKKADKN